MKRTCRQRFGGNLVLYVCMCDLGFTLAALSCPGEKRAMLGWGLKKANYVYAHMMKRLDEAIFYLLFYLFFYLSTESK